VKKRNQKLKNSQKERVRSVAKAMKSIRNTVADTVVLGVTQAGIGCVAG
jgi:hypothetical protein